MSYTARLEYQGIVKDFGNFSNARDCLEFISIDSKMIIIQYLLCRLDFQLEDYHFIEPSYIRPYNLKEKRYCDSFDF